MARLAAQAKKGYYPTPPQLIPLIANHLRVPQDAQEALNVRLLDPCCGKGEALQALGNALGLERSALFGCELDEARYDQARHACTAVCGDALSEMKATRNAFSLLYENPPYDFEGDGQGRTEYQFLKQHKDLLCRGGVLVYVVPESILRREEYITTVPHWFKRVRILRFPPKEYAAFGQVVLFGVKHGGQSKREEQNYLDQLRNPGTLGEAKSDLYDLPLPKTKGFSFYSLNLAMNQVEVLLQTNQARQLLNMGFVRDTQRSVKCLMPLREGHMALLLASGMMDGVYQDPRSGNTLVVAGDVIQETKESIEHEPDRTIKKVLHRPTARIRALDLDASIRRGELVTIEYR